MCYILSMTPEQRHILEKMGTVHTVRIHGEATKGALIVLSHNKSGKVYLSYRIESRGAVTLLSTIKESEWVNEQFKQMEGRTK